MRHIAIGLIIALTPAAWSADDDGDFFSKQVAPILQDSCIKCHGPNKQKARLRLDSRGAILTGGKHGPAAVPGKPDDSLLIKAVKYADDELQMPPRQQLSADKIKILVDWVQRGLPFPAAQGDGQGQGNKPQQPAANPPSPPPGASQPAQGGAQQPPPGGAPPANGK